MGDLISRSAIIDWINNHKQPLRYHKQVAGMDGTIFTKEVLTTMQKCIEVFETFINNMPTAYDVEKTVKEFKDLKEINQYHFECEKTFENLTDAEFHRGCVEAFDEAIKITENSCSDADIYGAGYKLGYEDGYNIAIDDTQKHISALYKDCLNGTAGDDVLAWNKALDKVREVIKAGGV